MASNFLRRLLGGRPDPPRELAEALAELDRLAQDQPSLTAPAAVLRDALPALFGLPLPESSFSLTPEGAAAKLAGGVPLLRGESPPLDRPAFRVRWQTVCAAAGRHQAGEPARALAEAVRRESLDPVELLGGVLAGRPEEVAARAEALGLDAGLTATVLRLTALPELARTAEALEEVRRGSAWGQGHCPTCGSWPLLGEFRGLEQLRFLRCGLCATGWEFPRLRCPFCGETDHRQLGLLFAEGEQERRRLATCDACRGYVKMVSSLAALSAPQLLVTDLATLPLDLVAADRGFFVP